MFVFCYKIPIKNFNFTCIPVDFELLVKDLGRDLGVVVNFSQHSSWEEANSVLGIIKQGIKGKIVNIAPI